MPCLVAQSFSPVQLFVIPWTAARQAPLSVGFSREEYWRGLSFPPPGGLGDSGAEPKSPALQVDSLPLSHGGIFKCLLAGITFQMLCGPGFGLKQYKILFSQHPLLFP